MSRPHIWTPPKGPCVDVIAVHGEMRDAADAFVAALGVRDWVGAEVLLGDQLRRVSEAWLGSLLRVDDGVLCRWRVAPLSARTVSVMWEDELADAFRRARAGDLAERGR